MGKISLRTYNREISALIERGENEEAIAHCKYILKQYPKHIDTYRLLGKAFLEAQRYTEASDILQRVLSVIPDDFVGHLGMSIIREDEGNLDAAIWHMERAFETQPSNSAVQEELRRLFGRRDGAEPHKIRLTRGALVRMYTRGELFNQAIAEARAALQEDPNRMDLMVMMARNHTLQGNKVAAVETATQILSRLPFCYEANRILAEILPSTARAADAATYQQRIFSLDPYAAFLSPNYPTGDQVPENAVSLERLDYHPGAKEIAQPGWAQTVGVRLDEPEDTLPDWLDAIPTGEQPANVMGETNLNIAGNDTQTASPLDGLAAENETPSPIPDWMQAAGWQKTDQPETESHLELDTPDSIEETSDDAVIAEIPEWLKEIAPQSEQEDLLEDTFRTSMLEQILPSTIEEVKPQVLESISDVSAETTPEPSATTDNLPPWLSESPEMTTASQGQDELPEWLQELEKESSEENLDKQPGEINLPVETIEPSNDLPDWLKEIDDGAASGSAISAELPEWLKSEPALADQTPTAALENMPIDAGDVEVPTWLQDLETPTTGETLPADDMPEWLKQITGDEEDLVVPNILDEALSPQDAAPTAVIPAAERSDEAAPMASADASTDTQANLDDAMAWLEALAVRQGVDEETLITNADQRVDETPDWISALDDKLPVEDSDVHADLSPTVEELIASSDNGISDPFIATTIDTFADNPSMVDVEGEATSRVTDQNDEMIVDHEPVIQFSAVTENISLPTEPEEAITEEPSNEIGQAVDTSFSSSGLSGEDDAFDWLESLARRQGAEEGTLISTTGGEKTVDLPSWLEETDQGPAEETVAELPTVDESIESTPEILFADGLAATEQGVDEVEMPTSAEFVGDIPVPQDSFNQNTEAPVAALVEEPPMATLESQDFVTPSLDLISDQPLTVVEDTQPVRINIPANEIVEELPEMELPGGISQEQVNTWIRELENESLETTEPISVGDFTDKPAEVSSVDLDIRAVEVDSQEITPQPERTVESASEPDFSPIHDLEISKAQELMEAGKVLDALPLYQKWVDSGNNIKDAIEDLEKAIYRHPVDIDLWQLLGDAFMQDNQIQKALDAYTKAEELIR